MLSTRYRLTGLVMALSLFALPALSKDGVVKRISEDPAPTADPAIAREFSHWRVMYSMPEEPVLVAIVGLDARPRGCFEGDAQPIADRAWFEQRPDRGTPREQKLADRLYPQARSPADSDFLYLHQRLFATPRSLTVLSRNGEARTITFNAVDRRRLPDGVWNSEFCHYYTIESADQFTDPHVSPLLGDDADALYKRPLEIVVVTDQPPRHRLSARAVAKPQSVRVPNDMQKRLLNVVRRKENIPFLKAGRADIAPIDYVRDIENVSWQAFDIVLDPKRPTEHVWSVVYWWHQANGEFLAEKVWGFFSGTRAGPSNPRFLWKAENLAWEDHNSGAFLFEFVADLNGDGVEEMIVQRSIFEGYGDAILTWRDGSPVVVYDGNIAP